MKTLIIFLSNVVFVLFTVSKTQCQDSPSLDGLFDLVWSSEGHRYSSNPLVKDGLVFETFGIKYALKAETGEKLFFANSIHQNEIRRMTKDSILYYSIKRGGTAVVNIYSGEVIYRTKEWIRRPSIKRPRIIKDSIVYLAINDSTFGAINIKKGNVKWQKEVKKVYDQPLEIGTELFLADENSLYRINKLTGETLELFGLSDPGMDMIYENGLIYFFQNNEGLICYDLEKKEIKWKYADFEDFRKMHEVINDSSILYIVDQHLHAISKIDGKLIWKNETAGAGKSIYTGSSKNYIFSYKYFDDIPKLVACQKLSGKIAYEGFTKLSVDNNSNDSLMYLDNYGSFRFARNKYNDFLYMVSNTGTIFCFRINE